MASSSSALVAILIVLGCAAAASAATFPVGDSQGWATGVDYTTWTSSKTFAVGDKLVFNYLSSAHTVAEVSKAEYDACTSSNTNVDSSSPTTKTLDAGTHYYICTVSSHCASGMKLAVTVGASTTPTPSPSTPAGTPPATPSTPTPTGASARLQAGPALLAAAAGVVLVKLALF